MGQVVKRKEFHSKYEYQCDKCGQPITPGTPYYIEKRYRNIKGERVMVPDRVHVECPEQASKADSAVIGS